ncbi:MAG: helix-turn-helix domain-containing protein [Candidatus Paceibacterota bacterium]
MNPLNQADPAQAGEDYLLTLYEVCEILGKSTRTITRYVHKHILHPRGVKSRQGTLEYRFSRVEIDAFKARQDSIRPYVYLNNKPEADPLPIANFADYGYLPPPVQKPFLIPGISFPVQQAPAVSQPSSPGNHEKIEARQDELSAVAPRKKENNISENEEDIVKPVQQKDAGEVLSQKRNDGEIILLLKETTGMLRDQLKVKDDQIRNLDDKIGQLIERNRETNILLKGLQDKIMLLEKPSKKPNDGVDATDKHSDANQGNQSIREFDNQPASNEALKDEKNTVAPIRIRVFSDVANNVDPGKEAKLIPAEPISSNAAAPRPSFAKNNIPEKKGLFGRLFK